MYWCGLVSILLFLCSATSLRPPLATAKHHTRRSFLDSIPFSKSNKYVDYRRFDLLSSSIRSDIATSTMTRMEVEALVQSLFVQDKVREHLHKGTSVLSYEVHDRQMDYVRWNELLSATMNWNLVDYAVKVFNKIVKQDIRLSYPIVFSLSNLLAERGMFENGLLVLDYASEKKMPLAIQHFLPLLKCCGSIANARRVLLRMERVGLEINVISYTAAIKSCEATADWRSALQLLELLRAMGMQPNDVTYSCAISVAARAGRADVALNLLREMNSYRQEVNSEPNQVCYGSVLTVCARCHMWDHVERLLEELEEQGAVLQESVLVSIMMTLKRGPVPWTSAQQTHAVGLDAAQQGPPPVVSSVPDNMEPPARVLHLLDKWGSRVSNTTPDVLQTIVMEVLESHGHSAEVLRLYRKRWHVSSPPPTRRILNVVMRSCVAELDADVSLMMLRDMQRADLDFAAAYNATIYICDQRGRHAEAVKLLRYVSSTHHTNSNISAQSAASHRKESCAHVSTSVDIRSGAAQFNSKLPPKWLIRRVVSRGLVALTRSAYASPAVPASPVKSILKNPHTALTAHIPFAADLAHALRFAVKNCNMQPDLTCYSLASRLLLEIGAVAELRNLMNQTLLLTLAVLPANLYEQAARAFLQTTQLHPALDTLRLLIQDSAAAGRVDIAANLLNLGISRIGTAVLNVTNSAKSESIETSKSTTEYNLSPLLSSTDTALQATRKPIIPFVNPDLIECATLLRDLMNFAVTVLGQQPISIKAYLVAVCVYKSAGMPEQIVEVYRAACNQHEHLQSDTHFSSVVMGALSQLPQFPQYTKVTLEIFSTFTAPPDLNMYKSALWASAADGQWETSLRIIDRMQQAGHPLDIALLNTAVRACSSAGRIEEVRRLLQMMGKLTDIVPNEDTFRMAILCYAEQRQWTECTRLATEFNRAIPKDCHGHINSSDSLTCTVPQKTVVSGRSSSKGTKGQGVGAVRDTIEALCAAGQRALAIDVYKIALSEGVVKPFNSVQRGIVDLQGHSAQMCAIAVTLTLSAVKYYSSPRDGSTGVAAVVAQMAKKFSSFAVALSTGLAIGAAPDMVILLDSDDDIIAQIRDHLRERISPPMTCSVSSELKRIVLRGRDVCACMSVGNVAEK